MDAPDDDVTLDALTPGVSLFQRRKGHRFSSDDLVTAWVATQVCPRPARVLDLGCGLGSVLLHLAWSAPDATLVGVEAQDVSFALVQRNVDHNALGDRVHVHHGDLRDAAVISAVGGPFDLVTGTPPYFPPDTATDAVDGQRAYARIEHRGGVEDYVATAVRVMTPDGWFVVCADADGDHRVLAAAATHGLAVHRRCRVIPRAGRPPLFTVWALRGDELPGTRVDDELTLRDAAGERTADARALRAFSGFPERSPG
jgi:tRNA1Val (adenine37-N6)-methyltransferase